MIDPLRLWLGKRPESLDVLVLPHQYGDIVSDLAGGLAGSVGLAPRGLVSLKEQTGGK